MRSTLLAALALLSFLAASPAAATSYVPMTDEALVDQAPLIAVVEVQDTVPGVDGSRPFTGYRVQVERVLKGAMAAGMAVTVRVPGGVRADGVALRIWGAPRFAPGERALLFLSPRLDGTYSIVHLMLGAFHEIRTGGDRLAVRRLAEARAVARPGEALSAEPLRDFDRFARWIAGRARGLRVRADYEVAAPSGLRQITGEFALFEHPGDGYNLRWSEFDNGQSVPWYAHQNGQPGVAGGGFAEFQTALAAFNDDAATNIAYTYAGTTTATGGFETYDTVNAILFDDPNDELTAFSCTYGGVLAYAGPWYLYDLTPGRGTLYHRIVNADIVTNNGLSCFFQRSVNGSKAAEELFAHELGHTLGIGHSEVDEALMRPYVHNDGRGASLRDDDRAAMAALYGPPPPPTDFFTVTPCRLLDTRDPDGPYGGPALQWWPRTFAAAGRCGIPSTAVALSVNVTAVSPSGSGYITLFPAGLPQPDTSTINFPAGHTRSNNAILPLSGTPERTFTAVAAPGTFEAAVHLLVDVNGYFQPED